jgi:hypothetical protein
MEMTTAKRRTVYDNPNVAALRDAERSRQVEAKRLEGLRERQARERHEMVNRHKRDSDALLHSHQVEQGKWAERPSKPHDLDARLRKEREDLTAKHTHERDKLKHRHDTEMAKAKK